MSAYSTAISFRLPGDCVFEFFAPLSVMTVAPGLKQHDGEGTGERFTLIWCCAPRTADQSKVRLAANLAVGNEGASSQMKHPVTSTAQRSRFVVSADREMPRSETSTSNGPRAELHA